MNTIDGTKPVAPTPKNAGRQIGHDKRVDQSARYSDRKNMRKKKSGKQDKGSIDEYA